MKRVDNVRIASGSKDNSIKIGNTTSRKIINNLNGHTQDVTCLELLSNGNLASGSNDGSIRIWSLTSYTLVKTISNAHNYQNIKCLKQLIGNYLASGSRGDGGTYNGPNLKVS